jgi:hypothetical protein
LEGIEEGNYPRIAALTAPAFGWPGVEDGALLNENPSIVEMVKALHVEAIIKSKHLKSKGLGEGLAIWWLAFDSERLNHGKPREKELSREMAFQVMVNMWVEILKKALDTLDVMGIVVPDDEPLIHLEYKPRVPGHDYISTLELACRFCEEVNDRLNRRAAALNNEWAHLLLGGMTVKEGTETTIKRGHFTGYFHANSAELANVSWDEKGDITDGTCGEDFDWFVGAGGQERWDDQQEGCRLMVHVADVDIIAEHDIDPSGDDPRDYYDRSRSNLNKMFQNVGAEMPAD